MALNIEQIKEYNKELKIHQEKLANARSRKAVHEENLINECKVLSQELGIEVTPENIEDIYKKQMAKMEETVATGTEIMQRIKAEEQQLLNQNKQVNSIQQNINQPVTQPQQVNSNPVYQNNQVEQVQRPMGVGVSNFGQPYQGQQFQGQPLQGQPFQGQSIGFNQNIQMNGLDNGSQEQVFDENIFGNIPPIFGK